MLPFCPLGQCVCVSSLAYLQLISKEHTTQLPLYTSPSLPAMLFGLHSMLCLNLQGWLQVRQPSCCLLLLGLPGSCRLARCCRSADFQFPLFSHARSDGEKRRSIDATWPNIFAKPFNQKGSYSISLEWLVDGWWLNVDSTAT